MAKSFFERSFESRLVTTFPRLMKPMAYLDSWGSHLERNDNKTFFNLQTSQIGPFGL